MKLFSWLEMQQKNLLIARLISCHFFQTWVCACSFQLITADVSSHENLLNCERARETGQEEAIGHKSRDEILLSRTKKRFMNVESFDRAEKKRFNNTISEILKAGSMSLSYTLCTVYVICICIYKICKIIFHLFLFANLKFHKHSVIKSLIAYTMVPICKICKTISHTLFFL